MPITLENRFAKYEIGSDGCIRAFVDKTTGDEWAVRGPASRCAYVKMAGREYAASSAMWHDGKLTIEFDGASASVVIHVEVNPGYFVFTVASVSGDVDEVVFVNLPTTLQARADEPFSASCIALNLQTNVEELPGPQTHLWAAAYRRFGFVGAKAGIVAAPFSEMREIMKEMVTAAEGVPHSPYGGPWAMDSDLPYGSYLFGTPTEETVDDWIRLCNEIGFTQIDFCGCLNYGDYQPFPHMYPNGNASVRRVTDRLHAAGILAGLHTMSFSIAKGCDWVTPVPDQRLAKEKTYTLTDGIGADDTVVPVIEPTTDLPKYIGYYVRRSMTVQIDDELIEYAGVADAPPYAVTGCKRGACGTTPAPHAKGAPVHHLKECWGCFAPDGESTLFGEVADRIATVINECGFDFTYLDGLDGAHIIGGEENRWHYGGKFAFEVYRRLARPIMMEMATFHHHLWFVRSRMQAWDHTIRGHKRFIDLHCQSNDGARRMFMPLHLGWSRVLAWLGPEHDATYRDDVEYMWCKGIGTDASYSLQSVDPAMYAAQPWLQQGASVIKTYETLRMQKYFPEVIKAKLREPGAEYSLRKADDGEWEFLPVQHARHKVEAIDGVTNIWSAHNRFHRQPFKLRIEALSGCAPYDSSDSIVLADFNSADEFNDRSDRVQILNSGKLYSYPAAAPGLSAEIRPASFSPGGKGWCEGRAGEVSGYWTATNAGTEELVCSSAPDDAFSLLDHAEREYRPRHASWVRVGKSFPQPIDLSRHQGMGVWVHGDGQGEVMNFRIAGLASSDVDLDHYVIVDFIGWRYFELLDPESERFEDYSWPYGRSLYKTYREVMASGNVLGINLWYNSVPVGKTVTCYLSPLKALPFMTQRIVRPSVTLGGRTLVLPVEMETGQYLELRGPNDCRLYNSKGELLREVQPEGDIPMLEPGANEITFQCTASNCRPRACVTIMAEGNTPLRR